MVRNIVNMWKKTMMAMIKIFEIFVIIISRDQLEIDADDNDDDDDDNDGETCVVTVIFAGGL